MVETNKDIECIQSVSIRKTFQKFNSTTAMILGTQTCNYLGQRIQNHLRDRSECDQIMQTNNNNTIQQQLQQQQQQQHHYQKDSKMKTITTNHTTPTSLFTIDSILASKPIDFKSDYLKSDSRSPSNSPPLSSTSSPLRSARVPTMIHPGLQLSHLAAAAASTFGTPSDFLGRAIIFFCHFFLFCNRLKAEIRKKKM